MGDNGPWLHAGVAIARPLRIGRYAEAARLFDNVPGREPDSGLRNIRDIFQGRPDMDVKKGGDTAIRRARRCGHVSDASSRRWSPNVAPGAARV